MPLASSGSTSRRLLSLLSLLQARRDWPARALSERLGVSERTVRRDIDRLRELDYAVTTVRGPDGGYRLRAGSDLPPLLFDDEQAIAVAVSLRSASALGAGLEDAAERALALLRRLLPSRLAHRIETLELTAVPPPGAPAAPLGTEVLLRIGEAIRAREELRYDRPAEEAAAAPAGTAAPRRIEPHHLLVREGRWYLVGFDPDRDRWRILRVDRLRLRSHTGRRFEPREVPGGDPVAYLSARFKGSEGVDTWPCWGTATIAAPLDRVAPFVGDGEAVAAGAEGAGTRVRLGAWSWIGLAAALLRFDAELRDVEPAELREAFSLLTVRAGGAAGTIG